MSEKYFFSFSKKSTECFNADSNDAVSCENSSGLRNGTSAPHFSATDFISKSSVETIILLTNFDFFAADIA